MTRRERLMSTLAGKPVDRPAVNFYEIGGFDVDPNDPDPFNIYNDPSWKQLLDLAEAETDVIRLRSPILRPAKNNPRDQFFHAEHYEHGGSKFTRITLTINGKTMRSLSRRDPQVDTIWQVEHLLKDESDLAAYLELPDDVDDFEVDISNLIRADEKVGDKGIVMVDVGDPLCEAANLFSMEDYTVVAYAHAELFEKLLAKIAPHFWRRTEQTAQRFPNHLWRMYGPEYATEPYLPKELFRRYVVNYTSPMVAAIKRHGGYARLHCHGRVADVLPMFVEMNVDATDPLEPPPQGNVRLRDVRQRFGEQLVLFGNIEASAIEMMDECEFEKVVAQAIGDGTAGKGRGFVLMPSSSPYGRTISARTMKNYETMIRLAQRA